MASVSSSESSASFSSSSCTTARAFATAPRNVSNSSNRSSASFCFCESALSSLDNSASSASSSSRPSLLRTVSSRAAAMFLTWSVFNVCSIWLMSSFCLSRLSLAAARRSLSSASEVSSDAMRSLRRCSSSNRDSSAASRAFLSFRRFSSACSSSALSPLASAFLVASFSSGLAFSKKPGRNELASPLELEAAGFSTLPELPATAGISFCFSLRQIRVFLKKP
mmetsp:Transcript_26910/g.78365  ORF Transcript_26910/g.78365 Transcript_26910/m.78365 type:complete len:223 (-) Transcript_26910:17-685(-)